MKALERKLAAIAGGSYTGDDFILADAKDADMAFGAAAAGPRPDGSGWRSRTEYLDAMETLVRAEAIDVLLTSASNGERIAAGGVLDGSPVTLAVRGNDSTDIWNQRGSAYPSLPSRPFRSADLEIVRGFADLVLYSVTFNNDLEHDLRTVEEYARFRAQARAVGIRHFLEVFNPNAPQGLGADEIGPFVNDSILRTLAGVTSSERPLFLKLAYNGPAAMAELVGSDPSLVVGLLGGSAGTTRDTFELLSQGERHGARVALFGRKIQRAESQLDLVRLMRAVLCRRHTPEAAVKEYHGALAAAGITPQRSLREDLEITDPVLRAG